MIGVQYTQPGHGLQSQKLGNVSVRFAPRQAGRGGFPCGGIRFPINDLVECRKVSKCTFLPIRWRGRCNRQLASLRHAADFGELVDQVRYRGDTVVLMKSGKPAAALVPYFVLERLVQTRDDLFSVVDGVRQIIVILR